MPPYYYSILIVKNRWNDSILSLLLLYYFCTLSHHHWNIYSATTMNIYIASAGKYVCIIEYRIFTPLVFTVPLLQISIER